MCHNRSACHVYIMWAELGHSYFLYVPAVSYIVTTGNSTGTNSYVLVIPWVLGVYTKH